MNVVIDGVNYKPVESKTSFDVWVDSMYDKYIKEADRYICVVDGLNRIVKLCHGKKSVTAKCSPHDKFSARVGIALAYARFNKLPIHYELIINENNEKKINRLRFRSYLINICYSSAGCKNCPINKLAQQHGANSCLNLINFSEDSILNSYSDEYLMSIYKGLKDLGVEVYA